jgi:hypothetical protein
MSLAIPTVIIQDDLGNTMSMTPTQLETGSGVTLQTTPLTFLSNLGYALNALTQPTDPTTCNFQNAIGVQDTATMPTNSIVKMGGDPATLFGIEYTSATNADLDIKTAGTGKVKINAPLLLDNGAGIINTINNTSMTIEDTASGEQANLTLQSLQFLNSSTSTTISNSGSQDLNITADGVLQLSSVANFANFNSYNVNNFGYAMPMCFTRERADNFIYNFGGQVWEKVYITNAAVPSQLFTDSSASYTSSYWKIDFALNCYLNSNLGDKGIAMYIEFEDQSSTPYLPNVYNLNTPYAVYQTASTFTNSSQQPFQNFNWSDIIDFSPLTASGSGNLPLKLNLWVAGDSAFTCNFSMVMTLTRTNLI